MKLIKPISARTPSLATQLPVTSAMALLLALATPAPSADEGPGSVRIDAPECPASGGPAATSPADPNRACEAAEIDPGQPPIQQADNYRDGVDVTDYWVSEKLDGARTYWDGRRLISRRGKVFNAPDWFLRGLPAVPLDGELWIGRGSFDALSGTVRRQEPSDEDWRKVRFMVFDLPASEAPFGRRLHALTRLLADANPYVRPVEQHRVKDRAALMAELDQVHRAGGEGLMLHRDGSLYRAARSQDLLKLKPYRDAEARVVEHLPGKGKYAGMMGALAVETEGGKRFAIGTGFSDAQRRSPPPVGSIVTYKYQGVTKNGVPRFASFLRVWEGL